MNKKYPKVSVVTAMYNHKPYLKRRIDSILHQTLRDWEWIIVDDRSPDGSFEYARELTRHDPRVTVLQNETNSHIAYTNQRGIELARGEFLYRTDSDDYCDYRFLERMVDVLEKHPNVVMAHCRGLYLDQNDCSWGGWPKKSGYVLSGWDEFRRILVQYHIKSPTILFRRETALAGGGFATLPLLCNHDWYLSLRACLLGDIAFIDEPLAAHRRHGGNLSEDMVRQTDAAQMEIELFGVIDDVLSRVPAEHAGEVQELRTAAYRQAAASVLTVAHWARNNARESDAEQLVGMVQRYIALSDVPNNEVPIGLQQRLVRLGFPLIKPLTYRKLRPLQAGQASMTMGDARQ